MNHKKILLNLLLVATVITAFIYSLDGSTAYVTFDRLIAKVFEFASITFALFLPLSIFYFGYIICRRLLQLISR